MIVKLLIIATSIKAKQYCNQSTISPQWSAACMDLIYSLLEKFFVMIDATNIQIEQVSSQLSFVSAVIPLLPPDKLGLLQRSILELCASHVSSNELIAIQLINLLLKTVNYHSTDLLQGISSKSIFLLWHTFSDNISTHSSIVSVRNVLELAMAQLLLNCETHGLNTAQLLTYIRCQNIEHVIELSMKNHNHHNDKHAFLNALLSYDASLFALPIFKLLQEGKAKNLECDDVISKAIIELNSQSCPHTLPSVAIDASVKGLTSLMTLKKGYAFGLYLSAMESLVTKGQLTSETYSTILTKSADFLQVLRKRRKNGILTNIELEFLTFMRNVLFSEKLQNESLQTPSIMFNHFSASLLKVLKSSKSNEKHLSKFLLIAIDALNSLDGKALESMDPSDVNKMMVSCLKFGISIDPIFSHCLVIVRLLLVNLAQSEGRTKEELFHPHNIFAMSFSHSNFESTAMTINNPTRRELLSLLICCLALGGPKIVSVEWEKISALLVGYNASLSEDDRLTRHFLFLYEHNFGDTVSRE